MKSKKIKEMEELIEIKTLKEKHKNELEQLQGQFLEEKAHLLSLKKQISIEKNKEHMYKSKMEKASKFEVKHQKKLMKVREAILNKWCYLHWTAASLYVCTEHLGNSYVSGVENSSENMLQIITNIQFVVLLLNMANTAAPINILAASDIQHLRQRKLGQVLSYLTQHNAYRRGLMVT